MALASIHIPADRARDMRAAALAKHVGSWPRHTLNRPFGQFEAGTVFRQAPGSNGEQYLVNAVACQCVDYKDRGNICKHIRAVCMFEAGQAPGGIRTLRPRFADLYPACPCGDLSDGGPDNLCFNCASDKEFEQRRERQRQLVAEGGRR